MVVPDRLNYPPLPCQHAFPHFFGELAGASFQFEANAVSRAIARRVCQGAVHLEHGAHWLKMAVQFDWVSVISIGFHLRVYRFPNLMGSSRTFKRGLGLVDVVSILVLCLPHGLSAFPKVRRGALDSSNGETVLVKKNISRAESDRWKPPSRI